MKGDQLLKLNEFNRQIVKNAPLSIIIIDKDGVITFANEHFMELSGSRDPLGRNIFDLPFFIREELSEKYKLLLERGVIVKKDHCFSRNKAKKPEYVNIVAVPLRNENGKIEGALSMAIDVSESVFAKQKLEKLNAKLEDRVAERTSQLLKLNKRLKKSLDLKKHFISDASHELRTPLTIAKLNIDLLEERLKNKKSFQGLIGSVNEEINKITEILEDLSLLTAIDEGHEKLKIEEIRLNKTVGEIIQRMKAPRKEKNISLSFKKGKKEIIIKGDKKKLEKLFLNIIRNAVKYSKNNGWIKVETRENNKFAEIIISDNGIGISKNELPYIFDRFYRANALKAKGEGGFGLGLAICKWITSQHQGSIEAKSSPGKGSIFTMLLPIDKNI